MRVRSDEISCDTKEACGKGQKVWSFAKEMMEGLRTEKDVMESIEHLKTTS
jgi:hypothetical protein